MKLIDYSDTYWGHNFYHYPPKIEGSDYHLLAIHRTRINKGDQIRWKTEYGYLICEVLEVKWPGDPVDMYHLEVAIVGRYDHNGEQLWP